MDITCQRCGLINDYSERIAGPHKSAYCNGCGNYIKHLPKNKPIKIHFGKYAGRELSTLTEPDDLRYLHWLSGCDIKPNLKQAILEHIKKN